MKHTNSPILHSLAHALLVFIYVAFVAWFMTHANALGIPADNENTIWGPILFFTLFVISAAITGALVLGRPLLLYLDGMKKEGILFFAYTVAWMAIITVLVILVQPWR
jgi:hypothetical protein